MAKIFREGASGGYGLWPFSVAGSDTGREGFLPGGAGRILTGMREDSFAPQNESISASLHGDDTYGLAGWRRDATSPNLTLPQSALTLDS